ncbi:DUF3696 domain-containing protein [Streptomyces sp. NPDC007070]|uniref:AAA family ATPase n=1 Tax=Streptomyces sp. NPDC007070 TaxID=3154312 RepID=UPI0033F18AB7
MALVRMALTNYRCFAQRVDVPLSPVTVILGRNNSGKSALSRTPMVLGTGIHTDAPSPLDLDELSEDVLESFTELIYGNRPHGSITVELDFASGDQSPLKITATIQNIDEFRTQVVSSAAIQTPEGEAVLIWEPKEPPETLEYTIEYSGKSFTGIAVSFQGILPLMINEGEETQELASFLREASNLIRASFPTVRYFGPFRDRPHRRYRLPARMPAEVGIGGENAAGILASDLERHQGRLIEQVNTDLSENVPGWRLDVVERGGMYSLVLKSVTDDSLSVNLADAGTGVAQVLPIFVQRATDSLNPPTRPVLEIIEQPELHLHPAAHGALADLYLSAAQHTKVRFIVETHSETFLLRLRRRIAEGVPPEMVAMYFVDHDGQTSQVRPIKIDQDGNLDFWPAGVFSEDYAETRALAAAQMERRAPSAN